MDVNCKLENFCVQVVFKATKRDWINNIVSIGR